MNLNKDVVDRVNYYQKSLKQNIGAYSDSRGHQFIRDNVKKFIINRDKVNDVSNLKGDNIFLFDGNIDAIDSILQSILDGPNDAILLPELVQPDRVSLVKLHKGKVLSYNLNQD